MRPEAQDHCADPGPRLICVTISQERKHMVFRLFTLLISLHFLVGAARGADPPEDPAVRLARILARKGAITAADLSAVAAASADRRVATLAGLLQRRGVLTSAELAEVWNGEPRLAES